jgi:hypothetical protein
LNRYRYNSILANATFQKIAKPDPDHYDHAMCDYDETLPFRKRDKGTSQLIAEVTFA